ncbi:Uncharacterised protein [Mycobacterium tuberculosis]|nr:Uncharacterised protein [Mycobacterium tuberculosis]
MVAGEAAREDATQAPPNQAHRGVVPGVELVEEVPHPGYRFGRRPDVAAEPPAVGRVPEATQDPSQDPGGTVAGQQAR